MRSRGNGHERRRERREQPAPRSLSGVRKVSLASAAEVPAGIARVIARQTSLPVCRNVNHWALVIGLIIAAVGSLLAVAGYIMILAAVHRVLVKIDALPVRQQPQAEQGSTYSDLTSRTDGDVQHKLRSRWPMPQITNGSALIQSACRSLRRSPRRPRPRRAGGAGTRGARRWWSCVRRGGLC